MLHISEQEPPKTALDFISAQATKMLSINNSNPGSKMALADTKPSLPEIKIELMDDDLGLGEEFNAVEKDIDW